MTLNEDVSSQVGKALQAAQNILITAHVRPDGDAVGSVLGLGQALIAAGKSVQMVLVDGVPSSLRHLPGSKLVTHQPKGNYDLKVVVDCSDLQRTGQKWESGPPDINIDHHITNLNFARLNLIDPQAVATSAILAYRLATWGFSINEQTAAALLTGIISDTLGFRTSNINPQAMRLAAALMESGADLPDLYNQALVRRSFQAAHFWGVGLSHLKHEDGLIWTELTSDDRNSVNYPGNDDADLVNFLTTVDEAEVVVIFVEQKEGTVKVSWRARPEWDVSRIALQFGGGGHPAASGAMITGTLEQVKSQILPATRSILAAKYGDNPKLSAV